MVRWLLESRKLSREQLRALEAAVRRREPLALSAISLLEIAVLLTEPQPRLKVTLDEFFERLQTSPVFRVLPLTFEIASEVAALGTAFRDPADRVIVATARVHSLRLITSDQRIIESKLAPLVT